MKGENMLKYMNRVDSFKSSAKFYLSNKKLYKDLLAGKNEPDNEQYLQYIRDDLAYLEKTLDLIKEKCGPGARLIMYLLFVERRTQQDVAKEYNFTRRQLQYAVTKWMREVFGEEANV